MKAFRFMTAITLILAIGMSVASCKKVNDADVQKTAQEVLMVDPALAGVVVTVQEQVATLTGLLMMMLQGCCKVLLQRWKCEVGGKPY